MPDRDAGTSHGHARAAHTYISSANRYTGAAHADANSANRYTGAAHADANSANGYTSLANGYASAPARHADAAATTYHYTNLLTNHD